MCVCVCLSVCVCVCVCVACARACVRVCSLLALCARNPTCACVRARAHDRVKQQIFGVIPFVKLLNDTNNS